MIDADLIIKADFILTMDAGLTTIRRGAIAVWDGKVVSVDTAEKVLERYTAARVVGGEGYVAFPGLVNTHTHAAMVYFRGLGDDLPLKVWLEDHIWPAEKRWLTPAFVADAVELACLEMLKAGITLYSDMYFYADAIARATKKMGLRAVVGAGIVDFPTISGNNADDYLEKGESFIRAWKGDAFITPSLAPHSQYACSPETVIRAKRTADKYGVPLHMHIAETKWDMEEVLRRYGKTPVKLLEESGILDERVVGAHCVWVNEEEIELLSRRGAGVSHCIESNLKLASGIAPVIKMLRAGVKVSLGTDGAASNNDLNILSEMATAAKVHKTLAEDAGALGARQALLMATRWGAEVLGLGGLCGSIEEGKSADVVLAQLRKPHLTPLYDIYSQIVYSMNSGDVSAVIVNGRVLLDERRFVGGDEEDILQRARKWGERIRADRGG